jgi:8-oxo-dGTP diphosphatase
LKEDKKTICKVVIICGPKILVLKRSRWVIYHPHRWDVPGGATDPGESIEQAAARECLEEAGFGVDSTKLKLINSQSKLRDGKPAERFCFVYFVDKEFKPKLSFEHSKYAWMEAHELDGINLPDFYKECARSCLADVELL